MIDKAIIYSVKHIGLWDEQMSKDLKAGKISKVYVDIPTLRTAIYEIGLGVIGADDKIGDPVEDSSIPMQFTEVNYRNSLREELRLAWAKACGVEITNKEKDNG